MVKPLANLKLGPWLLRERVGLGGAAEIWRADHLGGGPRAAVKVLHPDKAADLGHLKAFRTEFEILGAIRHPGVPRALQEGEVDGRPAFAMELIEGANVAQLLLSGASFPRLGVLLGLAQIAAFLHREQVIHADLKLENCLLPAKGTVRLVDFGNAKRLRLISPITAIFMRPAKRIFGTAAYLAPELIGGKRPTFASDLYALGVCAFMLLSGSGPFEATRLSGKLRANIEDKPPSIGGLVEGLPPSAVAVVDRCLSKDPVLRPSAEELADAAKEICAQVTESRVHRAIAQADDALDLESE